MGSTPREMQDQPPAQGEVLAWDPMGIEMVSQLATASVPGRGRSGGVAGTRLNKVIT